MRSDTKSTPIALLVMVLVAIAVGYILRGEVDELPLTEFRDMTAAAIGVDLEYYRGMLNNAAGNGCRLSIEEFRRYHALNDELERRALP